MAANGTREETKIDAGWNVLDSSSDGVADGAISREDLLASRFRLARVLPFQASSTPFVSNLLLAILSGLLLVLAFPDWGFWSFGWVGAGPLIMAVVRERRLWRSLLLGTVTGTVFYVGSSYWVTYSMHNYGGISLGLCYLAGIPIAVSLGIFTGLFAGVLSAAVSRFGGWTILAAPVIWPASEWLRLKVTGMGWNALGYSQAMEPSIIQAARFGGVYVVSALLVLESAALVFALIYLERRRGQVVLTIALLVAATNLFYGQSITGRQSNQGSLAVDVVQPNVPIDGDWDNPAFVAGMVQKHIDLSEHSLKESPQSQTEKKSDPSGGTSRPETASLVVWPESPMPIRYDGDPVLQRTLADFTEKNNVYLLMNSWESPDGKGERNSAIVISPSGKKISEYDKIALLPFGEYVPGRSWIPFMNRISALVGEVTPGNSLTLSDIAGARVGAFICFEVTRPEIARQMRLNGASSLILITDEAWFGPSAAPRQMLATAVFRAVENNTGLIRSTNSGDSASIDQYGRVEGTTPLFEDATRRWEIKTSEEAKSDDLTFYTRYGDVFAVGCVVLSAALIAAAVVVQVYKRRRG